MPRRELTDIDPIVASEMAYLGSLVLLGDNPGELTEALDSCRSDWFSKIGNMQIFEAITDTVALGQALDLVTLANRLRYKNQIESCGGLEYIASLVETVPTAANWKHYTEIIRQSAKQRNIGHYSAMLADLSKKDSPEARIEQREMFSRLEAVISDDGERGRLIPMTELMREWEIPQRREILPHKTTGFMDLDRGFCFYNPGKFTTVAARPGQGKSTLFRQLILRVAQVDNVELFSLEESPETCRDKMICALARVNYTAYSYGHMTPDEQDRVIVHAGTLNDLKIRIYNREDVGIAKIRVIARWHKANFGQDGAIFIDHLQLMSRNQKKNDNSALAEVTRSIKKIALETGVPIIAASQLNREVERRESKKPTLADLRDSGGIEADSDNVVFIYTPNEDEFTSKVICLGKHRDGPITEAKAVLMHYGVFTPQSTLGQEAYNGDR